VEVVVAAAATCIVKDVAAASTVEGIAAACSVKDDTVKDVAAAGTVKDVAEAVNVKDVTEADGVKDVISFERISKEPLASELEAGRVKFVALSEVTQLMSYNPSCITCFLLSTRASNIPR